MPREIVLLTGMREAEHLTRFLLQLNPDLRIIHAQTREELIVALHPRRDGVRLIGFCTPVIVPDDLIATLNGQAYNFHPGPPTHPGRHPASFAIYDGATQFGVTAHEMHRSVDSGPIIGVEWFDLPAAPRLSQVEGLTFEAAVRLFSRLGPQLANSSAKLPPSGDRWSGRKSRQSDFDALCTLTADIDAAEFDRRARAFADGMPGTLHISLHGRRFKLDD